MSKSIMIDPRSAASAVGTQWRGFTLVELLVVIGIIALLISILLPSLNRARQAASLIDCQSRMRQIGLAIQMYASENSQFLPADRFEYNTGSSDWFVQNSKYHITSILSEMLGTKDAEIRHMNPIFEDKDTDLSLSAWGADHLYHYNFNMAMFPDRTKSWVYNRIHLVYPQDMYLLRVSRIKRSSETVACWDGAVGTWWGGGAHEVSPDMVFKKPDGSIGNAWYDTNFSERLLHLNGPDWENGVMESASRQYQAGQVDFRHMNLSTANVLFLDGHVESRQYGDLYLREFCFEWK